MVRSACPSNFLHSAKRLAVGLFVSICPLCAAHATQTATTTQLMIAAPAVAVGVPIRLTATVTDTAGHPVLHGTVAFYDGTRLLGAAQIVSLAGGSFTQGAATLKTASFARGRNSLTAAFNGTVADAPSTSAAKIVTVTGTSTTITVLSATESSGEYSLTAALYGFGVGTPTGEIDFRETTSDTSLGTLPLNGALWKTGLLNSATPKVGTNPYGVVAADFDGDGHLDLATPNDGMKNVSVLLGNGDGSFKPAATYAVGNTSSSIAAGDFNNDGKPDLAVTNLDDGTVSILLGKGDGTFETQTTYEASSPQEVVIGDFNRDGNLDLAITGYDVVSVLLGNGNGAFQTAQTYFTSFTGYYLVAGDLNNDGVPDLVVASNSGDQSVLLAKGDGTFEPAVTTAAGLGPYLTLGDLNGDGTLDLVSATNTAITVSLGNGNGTFKALTTYPAGNFLGQPLILDFDQDGKPDVVAASIDTLQVLAGVGNGTLQTPALAYNATGSTNGFMVAADLNADGRPDLVVSDVNRSTESVFLAGQTSNFQLSNVPAPTADTALAQASFSGDPSFTGSQSNAVTLEGPGLDYSGGFAGSDATLQFNGSTAVRGNALQLTNGGQYEAGSAFTDSPINIQSFTTDFSFQTVNPVADGFTFTIQNQGAKALGGIGGGLGYWNLPTSVAIKFDIHDNSGEGPNSTGIYTNGSIPTVPAINLAATGINLHTSDLFNAHITYDGKTLTLTITDSTTVASWSHAWPIDIPSIVGGSSAYIGFTAGTGLYTSTETIWSWKYTVGPPAPNYPTGFDATNLTLNGSAVLGNGELELTNGIPQEAGSLFYSLPQNIQVFTTDFSFLILNPAADGFTFTIQNDGPAALGSNGGGLGYRRIPNSVAIKFDLYDNLGEGSDSTGIYTAGALPALPAIDLTGTGVYLHNEDPFEVHMTYDGVNLTMTIRDTLTLGSYTHTWPIDIPAAIGGNTAYVGFTGSTGGEFANQMILTWTFLPGGL